MTDSHIPVAGTDANLQSYKNTVGGTEVHSEAVTPTDATGAALGTQANPIYVSMTGATQFDIFTGQTSDASGDVTVALTAAPTSDATVFVVTNNARRVARFQSRTGMSLTVRVYKMRYDKATLGSDTVTGQPAGVTLRTSTAGVTTSANQSAGIGPTAGVGGNAADDATHTHTFNELWQHTHTVTQTETDQPVAASESDLNFMVIYR